MRDMRDRGGGLRTFSSEMPKIGWEKEVGFVRGQEQGGECNNRGTSIFERKDTGGKRNAGEDVEGKGTYNKDDGTGMELDIGAGSIRAGGGGDTIVINLQW